MVKRQQAEILDKARPTLERGRELMKRKRKKRREDKASEGLLFPRRTPLEIWTFLHTSPSSLAVLFRGRCVHSNSQQQQRRRQHGTHSTQHEARVFGDPILSRVCSPLVVFPLCPCPQHVMECISLVHRPAVDPGPRETTAPPRQARWSGSARSAQRLAS